MATRKEEEEHRLLKRLVEAVEQAASSLAHISEMLMEAERDSREVNERWQPTDYDGYDEEAL